MNFFTTERFTNALQAVGNIIAPLPEDYPVRDSHEEENLEEDSGEEPKEAEENQNEIRRFSEKQFASQEEIPEDEATERQRESLKEDEEIHRMDSIPSADWSPSKENLPSLESVDSDTESICSQHSSPQCHSPHSPHSPSFKADEVMLNQSEQSPFLEESRSLEALQNELKSYKLKVTSAFSEISSLSDDLRQAIGQNRDIERKLESEKETNRMLLSRIQSLSQTKEELVIQLSEVLESNDLHRRKEIEFEHERVKENEAYHSLSERYELVVNEKQKLTEALAKIKAESQRGQEIEIGRHQEMVQRVSSVVLDLLEVIDEVTKQTPRDQSRVERPAITEQTLCDLISKASETLKNHKLTKDSELQLSHNREIQRMEATLSSEIGTRKLFQQQVDDLNQALNLQTSHSSSLEQKLKDVSLRYEEEMNTHRADMERYLKRIQDLEREKLHPVIGPNQSSMELSVEGKKFEDVPISPDPTVVKVGADNAEFGSIELTALQSELQQFQDERDELLQILQSLVDLNSNRNASPLEIVQDVRDRWKALQSAHETSQRNEIEITSAHNSLKTEYQRALKSLQEVTQERDSLKKIMTEYKSKLDELLKTITEMKQLKEENANSKREFIRCISSTYCDN